MASSLLGRGVLPRPVRTCTQCKQVKLRCDSKEKFPAPCTRCQTRQLQCVVDSTFRRTPARKRVEEMAKEIEALKSKRDESMAPGTAASSEISDPTQESPEHPAELSGIAVLDDTGLESEYFELEDFVIERETVIEIFQLFCVCFYPHLPILNPTISISMLYETSPILFWTIIAIVTERPVLPAHDSIHEPLREPFLRFFQAEILDAPLPLQTIQAITYMTMYPFTVNSQTQDPSWLYSGIAVNAAMYMGLHRTKQAPSLRSIGVYAGSPRARAHTWLGCFVSSTALAKHVGVTAPVKRLTDLTAIEHMIRNYPLPPEFAYQVMVHHTLAKFFNTIVENSTENISHSLIGIIDAELDGLKIRFPTPWTSRVEMNYLTAKLLLYITVILHLRKDRGSREILMRNALSVAVRISYLTDQGLAYTSPEFPQLEFANLLNTLPKNYYRTLILSTAFLIRFFVLNNQATAAEQELARNHVAIAQRYLTLACKDPMDERARGAILFNALCRQPPIDLEKSKLKVDDRMAASLLYDAIATGHALRHEPVELEESAPKASGKTENKASEMPSKQQEVPSAAVGNSAQDVDMSSMQVNEFGQFDYALPEDLWGDSIWGMFDPIAPSRYPSFGGPGLTEEQGYHYPPR